MKWHVDAFSKSKVCTLWTGVEFMGCNAAFMAATGLRESIGESCFHIWVCFCRFQNLTNMNGKPQKDVKINPQINLWSPRWTKNRSFKELQKNPQKNSHIVSLMDQTWTHNPNEASKTTFLFSHTQTYIQCWPSMMEHYLQRKTKPMVFPVLDCLIYPLMI